MAVQTSYNVYHDEKYAGAVNAINPYSTVSRLNGTGDSIPFGYGVVTDSTVENGAKLPAAIDTALTFTGVAMRELNRSFADNETFGAVDDQDFTVVQDGRVAVVLGGTVTKDAQLYLGVGADVAGTFTASAGTGDTLAVLITNAKFEEAGDAGDVVWAKFK